MPPDEPAQKPPSRRVRWLMCAAAAAPLLTAAFSQRADSLHVGPTEAAWAVLVISLVQSCLSVWLGGTPSAKQEAENAWLTRDNMWLRAEYRRLTAREGEQPSS